MNCITHPPEAPDWVKGGELCWGEKCHRDLIRVKPQFFDAVQSHHRERLIDFYPNVVEISL